MRVTKWGSGLAIRIPASVASALELKEGDDVDVLVSGDRTFEIVRDDRHQKALERIRSAKWVLPSDWKFDRDEANGRRDYHFSRR